MGVGRVEIATAWGHSGRAPQASQPPCQDEDGPFLLQLTPAPSSRVPLPKGD